MRELRGISLDPADLTYRQRLILAYAGGLVSVVLVFTGLYYWGMAALEARPRSPYQAFNTVIEVMTTTGFGADSPWETPWMNLFVAGMQVSGVAVGFVTLRVLVIPLFERTPVNLDDQLTVKDGHVVVAEYRRDSEVLLDELEALDVDYVLVESDREEAVRLSDDGYQAIDGDPEDSEDLQRASIGKADVLITDTDDRTASVVLTALEHNESLRVVSFTASTRRKAALAEVGVDRSVAPHALIGQRLAEKATTPVAVGEGASEEVAVREILVRRDSPLHGVRVRESPLASHPELTLVAGWFDGELRMPPSPDERLTPNTVLVVAGPAAVIDEVAGEIAGVQRSRVREHSRVVVAGLGEGGAAAVEALPDDVSVTTVDESPEANPDVVGDATEPETLEAANVADATALVVTVNDDATALLTVAMARSLSDDVEILVRVTDTEKATAAFRAGADYVLSVQRVSARLVAAEVHGERVMDPVSQIRLVRADASPFAGQTVATASDPQKGWTVVGVVHDGAVSTNQAAAIEAGDEVFVAGSDSAIRGFEQSVD
ncbi:ion channel pore / TrkA domain protein [Halobacterium hubeiense]|uniref:Ion channel pore / TrkA domain protein n=1 Tax=Halobacterium hubeiense TaxID=1407499 RepID=A0A0U5H5J1_9EURY|nr:NAD-binding protein [Halobacterium hubeiense]CQH60366.1 ion channel pore / TrkA domain protein [Halobacterium hubeiense]